MEASEKQGLMEWMKAAIDLETEIATQEAIKNNYTKKHLDSEPKLDLIELPSAPQTPIYINTDTSFNDLLYNHTACFLGIVMGSVLIIFGFFGLFESFLIGLLYIIIGIILLIVSCKPINDSKVKKGQHNERLSSQYHIKKSEYDRQVEIVNAENRQRKTAYDHDAQIWRENGKTNLDLMNNELIKPKNLLSQLYAQQFVYPKYCNLPALTSIYEYFITGRCEELAGPHGAYNLYEDELRKDTVISQLNVVIENLEQIKQNQYMLYQQVKMIQQNTAEIDYELRQIKGLTFNIAQLSALNTYYAAITARNSEISATFHLLNG